MLNESQFETKYTKEIKRLKDDEGVGFNSALDNLFSEYNALGGDEKKFNELLIEWELRKA